MEKVMRGFLGSSMIILACVLFGGYALATTRDGWVTYGKYAQELVDGITQAEREETTLLTQMKQQGTLEKSAVVGVLGKTVKTFEQLKAAFNEKTRPLADEEFAPLHRDCNELVQLFIDHHRGSIEVLTKKEGMEESSGRGTPMSAEVFKKRRNALQEKIERESRRLNALFREGTP